MSARLFLGFDLSTQQAKVVATDDDLQVTYETTVKFDEDLPEFRTKGGVHIHADNQTVTAPTLMWVKAMDMLLDKMKDDKFDFSRVIALSGTAQQHGSVFWKSGAGKKLSCLNPTYSLFHQLKDAFSFADSPVWMDSSTSDQCKHLEEGVGGPQKLAEITGSRAYERFTGNQIAKVYQKHRDEYNHTERISLISSFGASLFFGQYAPIDASDGSGMNLMDLRTNDWHPHCLQACGDSSLSSKLGAVVDSDTVLGCISPYFVDRYGFSPDCSVVAFTGDNPAALAGLALQEGDIAVSLGTSDTVFAWLKQSSPSIVGHVLRNPVDNNSYMALLCKKNGSFTREKIRDKCCKGSWNIFTELLQRTPIGNYGNMGFYFDELEIVPAHVCGVYRFDCDNRKVSSFPAEIEVRAVIEGQFLTMRAYAEKLGYKIGPGSRVLATGGASSNKAILQILSDVFNAPVCVQDVVNATCLGCCYRSKHGWLGNVTFSEVVKSAPQPTCVATPNPESIQIYSDMVKRYWHLEKQFC